jgi:hypothetical protein
VRNRVPQRALERLELHEGKLSRAVLRGRGGGNAALLPGEGHSNVPFLPGGPQERVVKGQQIFNSY